MPPSAPPQRRESADLRRSISPNDLYEKFGNARAAAEIEAHLTCIRPLIAYELDNAGYRDDALADRIARKVARYVASVARPAHDADVLADLIASKVERLVRAHNERSGTGSTECWSEG